MFEIIIDIKALRGPGRTLDELLFVPSSKIENISKAEYNNTFKDLAGWPFHSSMQLLLFVLQNQVEKLFEAEIDKTVKI